MIRPLVAAAIAFVAAAWDEARLRPLPEIADNDATALHLPAAVLRTASAGYEALAADWYWLEAIQYFGTPSSGHFDRLGYYLETAADLDPEFDYLYQFAGETMPVKDEATKLWYNTSSAIHLLEQGMEIRSTRWQIPFMLAYLLYTFRGEYVRAGHYLEEAANRPRAPSYLSGFAAKLLAQGGSVDTAIEFAHTQLLRTIDQRTHDELEERLRALYLQKDLSQLNQAAHARLASGQSVARLDDLVGWAGVTGIPSEPFGGKFEIAAGGKVVSSDDDKLLHIFVHPQTGVLIEPTAN